MLLRSTILSFSASILLFTLSPMRNKSVSTVAHHDPIDSVVEGNGNRAYTLADFNQVIERQEAARIVLGQSAAGRSIDAWYFPGSSEQRALVIGGVHGSELSAIEVAGALLDTLLLGGKPYYSVVIIPTLFPDNAATAMNDPAQMGSVLNIGRYSYASAVDPNRQMPTPGKAFDEDRGIDHVGRTIERENQLLLQLIHLFRPARIASLHAIRNTGYGGIYADPRTDAKGIALGYETDSSLAVEMAMMVEGLGGNVRGNNLATRPNALYYKDPKPVAKGQWQRRNMVGSSIAAHRGAGVSMGTWGTTAIMDDVDPSRSRPAMRVLTLEFPGAKRPRDQSSSEERSRAALQLRAFTAALYHIFLGPYFLETKDSEIISTP